MLRMCLRRRASPSRRRASTQTPFFGTVTGLHRLLMFLNRRRLTRQSSGTPKKRLFSEPSTSRGASHFYVRTLGSFMSLRTTSIGHLQEHRAAAPVVIGSPLCTFAGRRSMRGAGRFVVSAPVHVLSGAQPSVAAPSRQAFVRTKFEVGRNR